MTIRSTIFPEFVGGRGTVGGVDVERATRILEVDALVDDVGGVGEAVGALEVTVAILERLDGPESGREIAGNCAALLDGEQGIAGAKRLHRLVGERSVAPRTR